MHALVRSEILWEDGSERFGDVTSPVSVECTSNNPWSFNLAQFANTMTTTVIVYIDGVAATCGMLGAFVKTNGALTDSMRGLQETASAVPFGPYAGQGLWLMTSYSDGSGGTYGFKFNTGSAVLECTGEYVFQINGRLGDAVNPYAVTCQS